MVPAKALGGVLDGTLTQFCDRTAWDLDDLRMREVS